jgi:hypothetical protein
MPRAGCIGVEVDFNHERWDEVEMGIVGPLKPCLSDAFDSLQALANIGPDHRMADLPLAAKMLRGRDAGRLRAR